MDRRNYSGVRWWATSGKAKARTEPGDPEAAEPVMLLARVADLRVPPFR